MSMKIYGLKEARRIIADERKALAKAMPRSQDPYTRGVRDALMALDEKIQARIKADQPVSGPPASVT